MESNGLKYSQFIAGTTTRTTTTTTASPTKMKGERAKNESEANSLWSMGYGEPYDFEKVAPQKHFDIRGEPVPVWDIIHGYVGHDQNPVSSNSYNISVISQTLGNEKDQTKIKQVKAKNSASSYIQSDTHGPTGNDNDTNLTESQMENNSQKNESRVEFIPVSDSTTVTPKGQNITTKSAGTAEDNIKLPENEISEMSPENYDYGDNAEDNESEGAVENWEKGKRNNENRKQETTTEDTNIRSPINRDTVNDTEALPLLPVITLSELFSGRYKKTRPKDVSSRVIVPYNKNGKPDYRKILSSLPNAQKRFVRRRIANINRKFNRFLIRYQKQILGIQGKEGVLSNKKKSSSQTEGNASIDPYGLYSSDGIPQNEDFYESDYSNFDPNSFVSQTPTIDLSLQSVNPVSWLQEQHNNIVPNYQYDQPVQSSALQSQDYEDSDKYGILLAEESDTTPPTPEIIIPILEVVNPSITLTDNIQDFHQYTRPQSVSKSEGNFHNMLNDYYNDNYISEIPSTSKDNVQVTKDAFLAEQHRSAVKDIESVMNTDNSPNPLQIHNKHKKYPEDIGSLYSSMRHDVNFDQLTENQREGPSYIPYRPVVDTLTFPSVPPHNDIGFSSLYEEMDKAHGHKWNNIQRQLLPQQLLPEAKQSEDHRGMSSIFKRHSKFHVRK